MSYPVTYYCPHCGTLVELERDGYLADKSVTPYPSKGGRTSTRRSRSRATTPTASDSSAARVTGSTGTRTTACAGRT